MTLQKIVTFQDDTRDLIVYDDSDPRIYGWLEIKLKPDKYPRLKSRPFTMPCRPVCGYDLHRVHRTCLYCTTRRVYTGKMAPRNRIEDIYTLIILQRRSHRWLKDFLLKQLLPFCEWAAH